MKMQLINGQFNASEAIDLLSQMTQVKIKFLENKILNSHNEEDIKSKESKIIRLQNAMSDLKQHILKGKPDLKIVAEVEVQL